MDFSQIKNVLGGVLENVSEKGKGYLETVSEKGKEYLETVTEKSKGVVDTAKDKTRAAGRVAKLTMELNGEKGALEEAYAELGKVYYEECAGSAMGIFAQLCDEITATNARIEAVEEELSQLKESLVPAKAPEADFEEVVAQDECCCEEDEDITVEIVEEYCCPEQAAGTCCEEAPAPEYCCPEQAAGTCCCEEAPVEEAPAEEAPVESCGCPEQTDEDYQEE